MLSVRQVWLAVALAVTLVLALAFNLVGEEERHRYGGTAKSEPLQAPEPASEQEVLSEELDGWNGSWWNPSEAHEPLPKIALLLIEGAVVDREGRGIGDVTIRLEAAEAPIRWREYGTTNLMTGPDGCYRFPGVPAGQYSVVAVIETWERDIFYVQRDVAAGSTGLLLTIAERPIDLPIVIRVKVLHPSGRLLEGGELALVGFPRGATAAISSGYGDLVITTRPAPLQTHVWLRATPPKGMTDAVVTETLLDLRIRDQQIRLDEPQTIEGRVLVDGAPCSVVLRANGPQTARADERGLFRFDGLAKGKVCITVHPDEPYGMKEPVVAESSARDAVVRLTRRVHVTGTIIPPAGKSLGRVHLDLSAPSSPGCYSRSGEVWQGTRSEFDLGSHTPGAYCELWFSGTLSDGTAFLPQVYAFDPAQRILRIELREGRRVCGRVVDRAGDPIAGAFVDTCFSPDVRWNQHQREHTPGAPTDESGRFTLTGLEDRDWYILASATGLVQVGPAVPVRGTQEVRLVMAPPLAISGRVVDSGGKSLYGITIHHWHDEEEAPRLGWLPGASVSADGQFSLEGLAPGPYVIYVWSNEWENSYSRDDRYAVASVEAGAAPVELVLKRGRTVEGSVTLADGTPAAAQVRIEGRWGVRRTWTRNGMFSFLGIPPGPCTVQARQDLDLEARTISEACEVEAGGVPIHLRLHEPPWITERRRTDPTEPR